MNKLIVTVYFLGFSLLMQAQPNLDSVKAELYKINKLFDSSRYLGFNVTIKYETDTLFGKFEYEEMSGKYIVNSHNLYYKMGNTEFAQNDSFVYNIYHDEKMMVMTKDRINSNASLFPLKEFVDSTVKNYSSIYTIVQRTEDDFKVIEFTTNQTGVPYTGFAVYYEAGSYYPDKFVMTMRDGFTDLSDIPDSITALIRVKAVNKRITMRFSNYYHPQTLEMFDDKTYVLFDRMRKKYRPAEKLRNYKFITNGVDGNGYDESIELYPPPVVPLN